MSDQDWQNAVLRELGVPLSGLVTPDTESGSIHSPGTGRRAGGAHVAAPPRPGGGRPPGDRRVAGEPAGERPVDDPATNDPATNDPPVDDLAADRPPGDRRVTGPPGDERAADRRPSPPGPEQRHLWWQQPGDSRVAGQPSGEPAAGRRQPADQDVRQIPVPAPQPEAPAAAEEVEEAEEQAQSPGLPPEPSVEMIGLYGFDAVSGSGESSVGSAGQGTGGPAYPGPAPANPETYGTAPPGMESRGTGPHAAAPPGAAPYGAPPPGAGNRMAAEELVRRAKRGDPALRRVFGGLRRTVGAAAAGDVRQLTNVEGVLAQPVSTFRRIAVTSIRGGAGKTTVTALAATMIAQYRQDRILAVDADSGLGSLPLRLGVTAHLSIHDLAAAHPDSFEAAARFLGRTRGGVWVLPGTAGGRIQRELHLDTFRAATSDMSRYFAAGIIDCGAGMLADLQRGILAEAHAHVMVAPGTVDGALSSQGALEWMAANGYTHLLPRTVIAFVAHSPHDDADLERAMQVLSAGGMCVTHLPYDRHLAAGTAVDPELLGEVTRTAALRIAVEVFARAASA